jgi:phosphate transport system protein
LERHFDQDLEALKDQLLRMGGRAEAIVQKSVEALKRRDKALANEVFADDHAIDRMEIEIDERCVSLLALRQPMAKDLRFITAALKISNDLERVGDHAVNIAGSATRLSDQPPLKPLVDIPRMADMAAAMLRESLDAFVRRDAATARRLVRRDDAVDDLNHQLFRELISFMIEDPTSITRAMELVLVARNLERVADLATNVAEEVVFIAEARIIKHHAEEQKAGEDFSRTLCRVPGSPRAPAVFPWTAACTRLLSMLRGRDLVPGPCVRPIPPSGGPRCAVSATASLLPPSPAPGRCRCPPPSGPPATPPISALPSRPVNTAAAPTRAPIRARVRWSACWS